MTKIAAGGKQGNASYVSSAPEALKRFHAHTRSGKEILGRLLSQPQMRNAWDLVTSNIDAQHKQQLGIHSPRNPYRRLWGEICTMIRSRAPEKKFEDVDDDLAKIEGHVTKLRDAIIDPEKTDARFDYRPLYLYFPTAVMKLNMQDIPLPDDAWEKANPMERDEIAPRFLRAWPTLSELLDELLSAIKRERKVERERKRYKRTRDMGRRFFVVNLVQYIERTFQMARDKGSIPVVAAIASAVFNQNVASNFVRAALRGK